MTVDYANMGKREEQGPKAALEKRLRTDAIFWYIFAIIFTVVGIGLIVGSIAPDKMPSGWFKAKETGDALYVGIAFIAFVALFFWISRVQKKMLFEALSVNRNKPCNVKLDKKWHTTMSRGKSSTRRIYYARIEIDGESAVYETSRFSGLAYEQMNAQPKPGTAYFHPRKESIVLVHTSYEMLIIQGKASHMPFNESF